MIDFLRRLKLAWQVIQMEKNNAKMRDELKELESKVTELEEKLCKSTPRGGSTQSQRRTTA